MKYRRKPEIVDIVEYRPGMEDGKTFRCEMYYGCDLSTLVYDICGMGQDYDLFPYIDTFRGRRYIGINDLIAADHSAVYTSAQLAAEYEPAEPDKYALLLDVARAAEKWIDLALRLDNAALDATHKLRMAVKRAREAGALEDDNHD